MKLTDTFALINPQVRDLAGYHLNPEPSCVKLNQNENPFDWPAPIKEEIARFVRERPFNRYPNFIPVELREAIAGYAGVRSNSVLVGNGSNEMLQVLLLALMNRELPVIIVQPAFKVYRLLVRGIGGTEKTVFLNNDLTFNVEQIIETCKMNPGSPLILNTPHNPTGATLSEDDISRICSSHTGFVILDQAYIEFGGYNAVPMLAQNPHLIITRTFSKAFAAAGLRLGYMIGSPEIIAEIEKIKLPYNINFFTDQVALILLKHKDVFLGTISGLVSQRDAMLDALRLLPLQCVYPSAANFILIRTQRAAELFAFLLDHGLLIRDVSDYPMLDNCLRISIGTPQENRMLIDSMNAFFRKGQLS